MRHVLFLCLVMTLVVPAASAQAPDTIGLWFDLDYSVNVAPLPVAVPFEAYLVLHEPSADAVAGAVFAYEVSDSSVLFVLATQWADDPSIQVIDGCTQFGYGIPRPAEPAMLLATFTYLAVSPAADLYFTVAACFGEVCPFYLASDLTPVCLETTLGNGFVACLGDCSVGTEATSWSAVKSLYR